MLGFREYLEEAKKELLTPKEHTRLYDFLHHLSSPTISEKDTLEEAHDVETVKQAGLDNKPEGNLFQHLKQGFHDAFPEGETPEVTKQKAIESRQHFRTFMTERGGHAKKNTLQLTSENGKTVLSSGAGMQTIGLALAPHTSSGYKHNLCPKASKECAENCLGFTAGGNRQYPEASFRAKLLRTQYVAEHPEHAARLLSHEIGENERWTDENRSIHNKSGGIVGYHNIKQDKVKSSKPKEESHASVETKLKSGEYESRKINSGFRGNVTSDLPYEKLMPPAYFAKHKKTQFYDYTKVASRLKNPKDLPSNYTLALSHTGTGHIESNDKQAIEHLERGGVVAMVHQKSKIIPTHVEDVKTGKQYPVVNGDNDDNVYDRHRGAGIPKTQGVVSGLKLKGVSNAAAGSFANPVDDDGIIRINK